MLDPSDGLPSGKAGPPVYKLTSVFIGTASFPGPSLMQ